MRGLSLKSADDRTYLEGPDAPRLGGASYPEEGLSSTAGEMIPIVGVMSGTSVDGIDVALCHCGPGQDGKLVSCELIAYETFAWLDEERALVFELIHGEPHTLESLSPTGGCYYW